MTKIYVTRDSEDFRRNTLTFVVEGVPMAMAQEWAQRITRPDPIDDLHEQVQEAMARLQAARPPILMGTHPLTFTDPKPETRDDDGPPTLRG